MIGSPPKKATNITQTCASRCIKCTFKIDNYLWHGFICCWQLEGRRACVSNTVTNLSTMFPYYKCSKCLVRHLGRPPTSPRNLFKFPLKIDKYLWHGFICCWPLEGRRECVSNTVTNLSTMFPYYKCSKCLVRHLGRPPTSPRNLFKFRFEMDTFWDWFSRCWPPEGRRPYVSNTITNLRIAFVLLCKCFKCLFRHLVGRPPTSPRHVL